MESVHVVGITITILIVVYHLVLSNKLDRIEEKLNNIQEQLNAQELIRCKDCVYWQDNNNGYPHHDCKWREDETPDPDDYCSAGEHK